jgi:uncharacterized protein (TIGR00251 family)
MLIKIKVLPCSKKQGIIKKSPDSFEIKVKEKPIQGQANKAVIKALMDYFQISQSEIKLMKGFKTRNKIFKIS